MTVFESRECEVIAYIGVLTENTDFEREDDTMKKKEMKMMRKRSLAFIIVFFVAFTTMFSGVPTKKVRAAEIPLLADCAGMALDLQREESKEYHDGKITARWYDYDYDEENEDHCVLKTSSGFLFRVDIVSGGQVYLDFYNDTVVCGGVITYDDLMNVPINGEEGAIGYWVTNLTSDTKTYYIWVITDGNYVTGTCTDSGTIDINAVTKSEALEHTNSIAKIGTNTVSGSTFYRNYASERTVTINGVEKTSKYAESTSSFYVCKVVVPVGKTYQLLPKKTVGDREDGYCGSIYEDPKGWIQAELYDWGDRKACCSKHDESDYYLVNETSADKTYYLVDDSDELMSFTLADVSDPGSSGDDSKKKLSQYSDQAIDVTDDYAEYDVDDYNTITASICGLSGDRFLTDEKTGKITMLYHDMIWEEQEGLLFKVALAPYSKTKVFRDYTGEDKEIRWYDELDLPHLNSGAWSSTALVYNGSNVKKTAWIWISGVESGEQITFDQYEFSSVVDKSEMYESLGEMALGRNVVGKEPITYKLDLTSFSYYVNTGMEMLCRGYQPFENYYGAKLVVPAGKTYEVLPGDYSAWTGESEKTIAKVYKQTENDTEESVATFVESEDGTKSCKTKAGEFYLFVNYSNTDEVYYIETFGETEFIVTDKSEETGVPRLSDVKYRAIDINAMLPGVGEEFVKCEYTDGITAIRPDKSEEDLYEEDSDSYLDGAEVDKQEKGILFKLKVGAKQEALVQVYSQNKVDYEDGGVFAYEDTDKLFFSNWDLANEDNSYYPLFNPTTSDKTFYIWVTLTDDNTVWLSYVSVNDIMVKEDKIYDDWVSATEETASVLSLGEPADVKEPGWVYHKNTQRIKKGNSVYELVSYWKSEDNAFKISIPAHKTYKLQKTTKGESNIYGGTIFVDGIGIDMFSAEDGLKFYNNDTLLSYCLKESSDGGILIENSTEQTMKCYFRLNSYACPQIMVTECESSEEPLEEGSVPVLCWDYSLDQRVGLLKNKDLAKSVVTSTGSIEYLDTLQEYIENCDSTFIAAADVGVLDYVMDQASDVSEIGFDVEAYKQSSYDCALKKGTVDDHLKAVTWELCPTDFRYNPTVAGNTLGVTSAEEMQALVADWDTFLETAEKLKKKGYYICTSAYDCHPAYTATHSEKEYKAFAKVLVENGYVPSEYAWSEEWYNAIAGNKTLGVFGTTWFTRTLSSMDGGSKYNVICMGPEAGYWGGSYLLVFNRNKHNKEAAAILNELCTDDTTMKSVWLECDEFVNNKKLNETMIEAGECGERELTFFNGNSPLSVWHGNADRMELADRILVDISTATIDGIKSVTYNGKAQTPTLVVRVGETVLEEETDYYVEFSNNRNAGKATATVYGIGDYYGSVSTSFTINKKSITVKGLTFKNKYYDGSKYMELSSQTLTVIGVVSGDYVTVKTTLPSYVIKGTVSAGSKSRKLTVGMFKLSGKDAANYKLSTGMTVTGTIKKVSVNKVKLAKSSVSFTGKAQKPVIKEITGNTGKKILTKNCTVKYYRNGKETKDFTSRGTIIVTVTGQTNWKGSKSVEYTIK